MSYDVVGKKRPKRMDHSFYSKNTAPTKLRLTTVSKKALGGVFLKNNKQPHLTIIL